MEDLLNSNVNGHDSLNYELTLKRLNEWVPELGDTMLEIPWFSGVFRPEKNIIVYYSQFQQTVSDSESDRFGPLKIYPRK
jgi:hypothetical protein